MNKINKRIFHGISGLAIFLVILLSTIRYNELHEFIDRWQLIPLIIVFSIILGAGTYALMSEKVDRKEVSLKKTTDLILKFLNHDERKIVQKLMDNHGKVLQAEITRLEGMTKLRTHRAVQKLLSKNIIEIERIGKTNIIKFPQEIKDGLINP